MEIEFEFDHDRNELQTDNLFITDQVIGNFVLLMQ